MCFYKASSLLSLLQKFLHIVALQLLEVDAGGDAFKALLQCALSAGSAMVFKELLDLVTLFKRAEPAQRGNRAVAAEGGNFFCQRIPMCFEVVPGDLSRGRLSQQRRKNADVILLANFALIDEGERALRQLRLAERRKSEKEVVIVV